MTTHPTWVVTAMLLTPGAMEFDTHSTLSQNRPHSGERRPSHRYLPAVDHGYRGFPIPVIDIRSNHPIPAHIVSELERQCFGDRHGQ